MTTYDYDMIPAPSPWREHIRRRPAMYLGDMRMTGFNRMLEFFLAYVTPIDPGHLEIEFTCLSDHQMRIRLSSAAAPKLRQAIAQLQAMDNPLDALEVGILLALSAAIDIVIHHGGTSSVLKGQRGDFTVTEVESLAREEGAWIDFHLDNEIFMDFVLDYALLNHFLRQFAILNPGVKIISTDNLTEELQRNVFCYPRGVFQLLDEHLIFETYGPPLLRMDIDASIGGYIYKVGIAYTYALRQPHFVRSFAGEIETYFGGSMKEGVLDGVLMAIKEIALAENVNLPRGRKFFQKDLAVVAAVRGENFVFEGSTKWKLGMPHVRKDVRQLVFQKMRQVFEANPHLKKEILDKFERWED
jgi:DNA gyrase/topoisomerase IV subunit B